MVRTALFSAGLGLLIAWNWGRLEEPSPRAGPLLLMVALGIAPALLPPTRWRLGRMAIILLAAEVAALLVAASVALHTRPYELGRIGGRAWAGFLDFYDVLVPFDGDAHPRMHGVLLLAIFVFTLLCALAVAARRPLAATVALAAGAGWPSTIMPGSDELGRGAFLLAAALALVAWLRPDGRRVPPQVLVGTGIVVVALIVSSSGAVARTQFVDWQGWDLSTKPGKRVGVEYVWRSNYDGIRWPRKRTRVFTVRAPSNSSYWRATTLDAFRHDGWDEDLVPAFAITSGNRVDLTEDPFVPAPGRDPAHWTAARVTIDALRDAHLVGPSQPVAYEAVTVRDVQYEESGIALALAPVSRGDHYTVWGYTPRPKPAQLAKSPPDYPPQIADDREFLVLDGAAVPPFGTPEHAAWISDYLRSSAEADRYRLLYRAAERIAGRADNPYAAAVALEAWFRSSGGFTYDEHPPHARGVPPLVDFVARTKRGYCQHFAGAMAVMLRYLGIPARVAAGFTSGNYDADRGVWNVTDRNAHTWVEVWFKGYGWLPFDPTPGRGTLAGSYTSASVSFDARGALAVLGASALAGRTLLRFELGPPGRDRQSRLRRGDAATPDRGAGGPAQSGRHVGTGGILALAALGLLGLFVLAKLALRRSRYLTKDPRLIAAACRRELVEYLLDQGVEVPRSAGPRELGRLLTTRIGPGATAFAEALGAARYGPLPSAETAARDARRELRRVRGKLRRSFAFGRRVRGLLSPRSLVGVR